MPWSTLHAFLRLTTHASLFPQPLTIVEAITITTDKDFRRFGGVQVRNPLVD